MNLPDSRAEVIRIVAAVVRDEDGRILLVRKRGTHAFMQPGGKIEPGEDHVAALGRELAEELGCAVEVGSVRPLGTYRAPAANEPGRIVEAALYGLRVIGEVAPRAEIDAIAWVDPLRPGAMALAPLTRDHVLPLAAAADL